MSSLPQATSSEEFNNRLNLLINGFVRSHDFIPSEIVCIIFDQYCALHFQWQNRHITLQIVSRNEGGAPNPYFLGETKNASRQGSLDGDRVPSILGVSSNAEYQQNHKWAPLMSPVWRMYPLSEQSRGFILRPLNVTETEDVVNNPLCKYLAPRGLDTLDEALSLQLVRPDDGADDEYYFQNVDDGKYIAVDYDEETIDDDREYWMDTPAPPSLRFEDSPSDATLFRIKERGPSFDVALDLRIGSGVCYFAHLHSYHAEMALSWRSSRVKARIIDLKQEEFGRIITLKCDSFGYENDGIPVKIDWKVTLSAESALFGDYSLRDRYSRSEWDEFNWRMWQIKKQERSGLSAEEWAKKQRAKERWIEREGEIGDFQVAVCEALRVNPIYEKRVKSRDKKRQKRRKRQSYRNWNGKCDDKRVERKMRKYGVCY